MTDVDTTHRSSINSRTGMRPTSLRVALTVALASWSGCSAGQTRVEAGGGTTALSDSACSARFPGLDSLRAHNHEAFRRQCEQAHTFIVFGLQLDLRLLGYLPGPLTGALDEPTRASARRYESDRHLPHTDDPLNDTTLVHLFSEGNRVLRALGRAKLPEPEWFAENWSREVLIWGPWIVEGDSIEQREVRVDCDRGRGECVLSQALLFPSSDMATMLEASPNEVFRVTDWDAAEISGRLSAAPVIGQPGGCDRAVLRINRIERSVTRTRSIVSQRGLCDLPGFTARPGVSRLATAAQAGSVFEREGAAVFDSLLQVAPAVRAALTGLRAIAQQDANAQRRTRPR
jgi:hypothetical protein